MSGRCFWCDDPDDPGELSLERQTFHANGGQIEEIHFHKICALNAIARLAERLGGAYGSTFPISANELHKLESK
jgi:hypothetical protein